MLKKYLFLVLCLCGCTTLSVKAAACDGSKSAFFDAVANDTAVINESTDLSFGTEKTVVNTLGGLRARSAARVIFTVPGSSTNTKKATITITTSEINKESQILQFALGPIEASFTTCLERGFSTSFFSGTANNPTSFSQADLAELAPNDGTSSYVMSTDAFGVADSGSQTYGAEFVMNVIPGMSYEATCGSVSESADFAGTTYDCNITVSIPGSNGDGNNGDEEDEEPSPPIETTPEAVKIQPATTSDLCPLSSAEHLDLAIKTEQALKLRLDRQAQDLQDAVDAVSDAGINPGPALRRLDALVEFVRDDISDTRNVTKGGLEFSKRHLACAKEKLEPSQSGASPEIDQAIVNDDAAITEIMTEDSNINEESVRLKGTLQATSLRIQSALADKAEAGAFIDSGFTMPDFASEDVNDVFTEFQTNIASLADQMITKLGNQQSLISANDKTAAVDAILELQADDCIDQFFDEVVQEYTRVHTATREALKKIEEEAKAAAQSDSPDPAAPTVREGKQAARSVRKVDAAYKKTVVLVNKTKRKFEKTYGSGLAGSAQKRFDKKVRTLLGLLRKAELAKDTVWRRLIRKELKKLAGVGVGI